MAVPDIEPAALLEAMRGRSVLVVDDERDIAELIAGQLAPLQVKTTIAASGEEALELSPSGRFDAITLDILMPGVDGFEVLRSSAPTLTCATSRSCSCRCSPGDRSWPASGSCPSRSTPTSCGTSSEPRSAPDDPACSWSAREELQPVLEPALDELGIEHQWEVSGAAAARVCGERRFEVAFARPGIRNPVAVLQALDLRGRRLRRAVIVFSDGNAPAPPGIDKLGMEIVPVDQAAMALLGALHTGRHIERISRTGEKVG